MTRLLIAYDGSDPARAALAAAAALFPGAEAVVATVQPPFPSLEAAAMARIALPDAMIRVGIENLRAENEREGGERVAEGVELGSGAGLVCSARVLHDATPWRALRAAADDLGTDVLVCGTRGEGPLDRALLGSTAASLLHHADRPLLIVPAAESELDGPVLAGYDESEGARVALRFAAAHLPSRRLVVAHAWRSPVRHSLRGRALAHSGVEMFEDYASAVDEIWSEIAMEAADAGTAYARELGLDAEPVAPESRGGPSHALIDAAREVGAAVVLAGSRGRGAIASTVLGSVTSGVVNAAAQPVLVVPGGAAV
jgi:nucleotide-binding universal stress UspA family protein